MITSPSDGDPPVRIHESALNCCIRSVVLAPHRETRALIDKGLRPRDECWQYLRSDQKVRHRR